MSKKSPQSDPVASELRTTNYVPQNAGHNSKLLGRRFRDQIRYVDKVGFFVWDGSRWAPDPDKVQVFGLACEHVKEMVACADTISEPKARMQAVAGCRKYGDGEKLRMTVKLLPSNTKGLRISRSALNRQPMLLNVQNGTINLSTGKPREADPKDLITKLAPVKFEPKAGCPRWERFITAICSTQNGEPRPAVEALVKRIVGYTITGRDTEKMAFWFVGPRDGGKTTLQNVLTALLGEDEYAIESSSDPFMRGAGNEARIVRSELIDIRAVFCSEIKEGAQVDEEIYKSLTGRERGRGRGVYQQAVRYRPEYKLIFLANLMPRINPNDPASLSRTTIIPLEHTFKRGDDMDPEIESKLKKELPGILNWAIEGCLEWQKRGIDAGSVPEVVARMDQYRRDLDTIGPVLATRYELGSQEWWAVAKKIHEDYIHGCEIADPPVHIQDEKAVGAWLRAHGCTDGMEGPVEGRFRVWRGIRRLAP